MDKNVGSTDKVIRIVVGLAILVGGFTLLQGSDRWLGFIGLIPILTAVVGWCPGWAVLGINTRKTGPDKPA